MQQNSINDINSRLDKIYSEKLEMLIAISENIVKCDADAQDCVNNVFVRLLDADCTMQDGNVLAYIIKAVRNESLNSVKARATREKNEGETYLDFKDESPLYLLEVKEIRERINKALVMVRPVMYQDIWQMCCIDGVDRQETANQMSLSLKQVRDAIYHVNQQLRPLLSDLLN